MMKRRGLGSLGVDVLLSAVTSTRAEPAAAGNELKLLPIESVRRGKYQPRGQIKTEDLEALAASIRAQGLVQPIVVRPADKGYELIAGERRWRAAQLAGLLEIPAVIKPADDAAAAALALIENIQRQDLNAIEEAAALKRLLEEFGLTHQQTADAVGRSRAAVSNLLRLLDLSGEVRQMLIDGEIEMGHARALLALQMAQQVEAARTVAMKKLSVRETERFVKRLIEVPKLARVSVSASPDIAFLQRRLEEALGARVALLDTGKGRGKLVIHYSSIGQLDGLLERFGLSETPAAVNDL
jgi:ParB family transcriptional regulator, chromosome partitioning protein